jgi:hypothetical protein
LCGEVVPRSGLAHDEDIEEAMDKTAASLERPFAGANAGKTLIFVGQK